MVSSSSYDDDWVQVDLKDEMLCRGMYHWRSDAFLLRRRVVRMIMKMMMLLLLLLLLLVIQPRRIAYDSHDDDWS